MIHFFSRAVFVAGFIASLRCNPGQGAVCKSPPKPVENAILTPKSEASPPYFFGDAFVYSCKDPLYRISPNITECTFDGTWSLDQILPSCFPRECRPPPRMGRGSYEPVKKSYKIGDRVTYKCAASYAANQTLLTSTCRVIDFKLYWDLETVPECVAVCPEPAKIANAEIYGATPPYFSGKIILYKCKELFNLNVPQVEATSTCQIDRTWSRSSRTHNLPVCCKYPESLHINHFDFMRDSREDLNCSTPPTIANGQYTPAGPHLPGHAIQFSCFNGFKLKGDVSQTCQATGDWLVAKFPKCVSVSKPTESLRLRCYKCDWKTNPFCYYGTNEDLLEYEDCTYTKSQYAYCVSKFVTQNGTVKGVERGCKYKSYHSSVPPELSNECHPSKQKEHEVQCDFPCTEPSCNLISANELRACPECVGHSFCDHLTGRCECKEGYRGLHCEFYIQINQRGRSNANISSSNSFSGDEMESFSGLQRSSAVHLLPPTSLLLLSFGFLLCQ